MKIESKENEQFISIIKDLIEGLTIEEISKKQFINEIFIKGCLYSKGCKYDKEENIWYTPIKKNTICIIDECIEMIPKETLLEEIAKMAAEDL